MPHLTVPLTDGVAVIDLYVGISNARRIALTKLNKPLPDPQFQRARAIIDTGASDTCIDPAILGPLLLTPTGIISIHTPSTAGVPHLCEQYDVSLGIHHPKDPLTVLTIPVILTDLAVLGFQALIGRDVLGSCLFIFDGSSGTFTLAF